MWRGGASNGVKVHCLRSDTPKRGPPMSDSSISLMRLAPYTAMTKALISRDSEREGCAVIAINDFDNIIRHFLRLIPFDETEYLRLSPELEDVVGPGRPYASAREHFIKHGYFEG